MDFELTKEQKDIVSAAKEFAEGEFEEIFDFPFISCCAKSHSTISYL